MTKKKTVLVLGTNAGQADLIRHMVSRGWHTIGCAHVSGLPGEALAHGFEKVDVRDVDAVAALARRIGADLVYSVSSDLAIKTAIAVSERLGLPHFYDSGLIELLDQKHLLRALLNERGLSVVPYTRLSSGAEAGGWTEFPCVVKPADAQGQRGVVVVHSVEALAPAVDAAVAISPTRTAIIERYLSGVEVSSNVLVRDGKVVINEVSERLVHRGELFGIPKGHLVPCYNVSPADCEAVRQLVRDVVAAMGLDKGCLYFQMKITPDGPKIIEIAPRLDGCHMWRLIFHSRGIDFLEATVDALIDLPMRDYRPRADIPVHELIFQQTPPHVAFSRAGFPQPFDALYHEYRYADGEAVQPINGRLEVAGYYVRTSRDADIARYEAEKP